MNRAHEHPLLPPSARSALQPRGNSAESFALPGEAVPVWVEELDQID